MLDKINEINAFESYTASEEIKMFSSLEMSNAIVNSMKYAIGFTEVGDVTLANIFLDKLEDEGFTVKELNNTSSTAFK